MRSCSSIASVGGGTILFSCYAQLTACGCEEVMHQRWACILKTINRIIEYHFGYCPRDIKYALATNMLKLFRIK